MVCVFLVIFRFKSRYRSLWVTHTVKTFSISKIADDHTCRLWDVETRQEITQFRLLSPGVSVKWIPNEPNKVNNKFIKLKELVLVHWLLPNLNDYLKMP